MRFKSASEQRFGIPQIEINGVLLPSEFKTYFLFEDSIEIGKKWALELHIEFGEEGTPFLKAVLPRANPEGMKQFGSSWKPVYGIQSRHLEFISSNLKNLLLLSIDLAEIGQVAKSFSFSELKDYKKELISRASKTKLTPEFIREVKGKKLEIQKGLTKSGLKDKSNKILSDLYGVEVKTVEAWLAKPKISARKAGSKKVITKKGKGTNGTK